MEPQPWMTNPAHDADGNPVYDLETGLPTVAHYCEACDLCSTPKTIALTVSDVAGCTNCLRTYINLGLRWVKWITPPTWTGGAYSLVQDNGTYPCIWHSLDALVGDAGELGFWTSSADCIADNDPVSIWTPSHVECQIEYGIGPPYTRSITVWLRLVNGADWCSAMMFHFIETAALPANPKFDCCEDAWGGANDLICDTGTEHAEVGLDGSATADGECTKEFV